MIFAIFTILVSNPSRKERHVLENRTTAVSMAHPLPIRKELDAESSPAESRWFEPWDGESKIKQVDWLLSNAGVAPWDLFGSWIAEVVGARREIVVAMDWTDFDRDNQCTLALHLVTSHGRATPLLWLTVDKDELKDQRNDFEDLCLSRLKELLPEGVTATILADRGFGDVKLFEFLVVPQFEIGAL